MAGSGKVHLILGWHMHQPDYRNALTHTFELPWTYLHAWKDYTDMAYHLERHPRMRAVVNLVPSLLEQWRDYAEQGRCGVWRDPLLQALQADDLGAFDGAARVHLIEACLRCHAPKMIEPFPAYRRLRDGIVALGGPAEAAPYVSDVFLHDLLMWYHLAWSGETLRRESLLLQRLMEQGERFTAADRQQLLQCLAGELERLAARYAALQKRGQIELSTTPASHPIIPLLLDFNVAREALPHLALPQQPRYPGGEERARVHIAAAQALYRDTFGAAPQGFWPAEGALSTATLSLFAETGLSWTASGETLLANSLRLSWGQEPPERSEWLYQPYRFGANPSGEGGTLVYFRDDSLSDRIGFEYAQWDGDRAARDFIERIEAIGYDAPEGQEPVVSIILDGENAWEYYPYNGYYFLDALYQGLEDHHSICLTTFADMTQALAQTALPRLERVVAGSWVYGTLTTWIGDKDKNRAWDLLVQAKRAYDRHAPSLSSEARQRASAQLQVCESSDWFWWFGDYNSADSVRLFDRLYRLNLATLYHLLELEVPASLKLSLSLGSHTSEGGGAMRRTSF